MSVSNNYKKIYLYNIHSKRDNRIYMTHTMQRFIFISDKKYNVLKSWFPMHGLKH